MHFLERMMKINFTLLCLALTNVFTVGSAGADIIATTLSCQQASTRVGTYRLTWNAEYKIDKSRKMVLGMRNFNFSDRRPDGRYVEIRGNSRVTFFKNGTLKYLKYERYNDMNRLNRFEFYEMMYQLQKDGKLFAKCSIKGTRILSRKTVSNPPSNPAPLKFSGEFIPQKPKPLKTTSNDTARYISKTWQSEWTNPNGSKSTTNLVLHNIPETDGRVGSYDWSNGRFIGAYKNNGARFEGQWVQDKSSQRCQDSVNGSFYHGKVWFQIEGSKAFFGKWGYCNNTPRLDWQGWR